MRSARDTTLAASDVDHLASILFHMNARDPHMRGIAIFGFHDVLAALADRQIVDRVAL